MPPFSFFFLVYIFSSCASLTSSAEMEGPSPSPEANEWSSQRGQPKPKETDSCRTGNPMDDCWRCDPEWHSNTNRKMLADCAVGFGRDATGGRGGEFYVVTDPENDNPVNPIPGTLRYAAIQEEPLWIIFNGDMIIRLKDELLVNSFKTIDGRGANVEVAGGPCITLSDVTNIIIHGIHIHHCVPGGNTSVRDSPIHYGWRNISDGDGISIFGSTHVWIDHCTLSHCHDGLIDVTYGSTSITISNNHMSYHDEVMLMGHSDDFLPDKNMQVTIAFNYFGEGLVQRIPRCRHGYFHIVNNLYSGWELYAVGGSANPTINSQGNIFIAPDSNSTKEVTRRINSLEDEWKVWNWRSVGDLMLNGAFFTVSGNNTSQNYVKASSMIARPASLLTILNVTAGALSCQIGYIC